MTCLAGSGAAVVVAELLAMEGAVPPSLGERVAWRRQAAPAPLANGAWRPQVRPQALEKVRLANYRHSWLCPVPACALRAAAFDFWMIQLMNADQCDQQNNDELLHVRKASRPAINCRASGFSVPGDRLAHACVGLNVLHLKIIHHAKIAAAKGFCIARGTWASASTTFARISCVRAFISCSLATAAARRISALAWATTLSASACSA